MRASHVMWSLWKTDIVYYHPLLLFLRKTNNASCKRQSVSDLVESNANIYCKHQSVHQSAGLLWKYLVVESDCSFINASLYVNMNALSANKENFHLTSLKHTPFNVNSHLNVRRWILKNKLLNCHLEENVANDKAIYIFQTWRRMFSLKIFSKLMNWT